MTTCLILTAGVVYAGPCKLGVIAGRVQAAGTLVLRDGGDATSPVRVTRSMGSTGAFLVNLLPGSIRFENGIFAVYEGGLNPNLSLYLS